MIAVPRSEENIASRIIEFIGLIGLRVEFAWLKTDTFLPGVDVRSGGLVVDLDKLEWPGDLLHEAGHLAMAPAKVRQSLSGEVILEGESPTVVEAAAMLWSYAATLASGVDPELVFHDGGYRGHARGLIAGYAMGVFPGLPFLEKHQMAFSPRNSDTPFPQMAKWLRD